MPGARWATIRAQLITIPARVAATGRQLVVYLPRDWAWASAWEALFDGATGPPPTQAA